MAELVASAEEVVDGGKTELERVEDARDELEGFCRRIFKVDEALAVST